MKNVLKSTLLLVFLCFYIGLQAQTYRLEVGYNQPIRLGTTVSSTYFNGIRLGGTAEWGLKNNLSLLTGALYNIVYANKLQGYPNSATVTYRTFGHYLDIPLHINYTYPITNLLKIFAYAGPNFNIGLFQNMKVISTQTYDVTNPMYVAPGNYDLYSSTSGEYQLNRINLQLDLGGGVQWKKYQLKAGYDFGINYLNKTGAGNLNQQGWYVTVAYQF